ncbi:MAG: glycosyltransferase [Flavobacteriaceae bacterium]|nr:glycosyltransferase [Flavobacteriaceae bacterium]
MSDKKYIIKGLAPWMMDELIAFSKIANFDIIFLRNQDSFYQDEIEKLRLRGIKILVKPFALGNIVRKIKVIVKFIVTHINKFYPDYNFVLGIKSIIWFLRLDLSHFTKESKIHAQFATQAALVSYLVKEYFKGEPKYSFTFHAYDIYFNNRWFKPLVKNSEYAFSISDYNIEYVKNKFIDSEKIVLSRLGVFKEALNTTNKIVQKNKTPFTLGLLSWFVQKKGISYLLQAMLEIKKRGYENIKLNLAGDGPLKGELEEYVKENNLHNTVKFIGKLKGKEKVDFYKEIDVFVLPSITLSKDKDGIPVVLMEAIAYSLPLISTKVSGIPEICINQYNGLLIEEKNISDLVNSIIYLYDNNHKIELFSSNSLILSNTYDIVKNSKEKMKLLTWD